MGEDIEKVLNINHQKVWKTKNVHFCYHFYETITKIVLCNYWSCRSLRMDSVWWWNLAKYQVHVLFLIAESLAVNRNKHVRISSLCQIYHQIPFAYGIAKRETINWTSKALVLIKFLTIHKILNLSDRASLSGLDFFLLLLLLLLRAWLLPKSSKC